MDSVISKTIKEVAIIVINLKRNHCSLTILEIGKISTIGLRAFGIPLGANFDDLNCLYYKLRCKD